MDILEHEQNDDEEYLYLSIYKIKKKHASEYVWASRGGLEGPDIPPLGEHACQMLPWGGVSGTSIREETPGQA